MDTPTPRGTVQPVIHFWSFQTIAISGSAQLEPVMPIYLKALSWAPMPLTKEGRASGILTTAVFDMQPIRPGFTIGAHQVSARYYHRFWKTI